MGEQPGDQEDLAGQAVRGARRAVADARHGARPGSTRDTVYLTNAVKHFKFEQRGKRRIHAKPTAGEVEHYRPLADEGARSGAAALVVALGGTALLALSGKALPVTKARGPAHFENRPGYVTVHPSYLLRIPNEADKRKAYEDFVGDLARIHDMAEA